MFRPDSGGGGAAARGGRPAALAPPAARGPGAEDRRLVAVEASGTPRNPRFRGDPARLKVTALPREARPRERLCQVGPEALGTTELLAIVLGTGTRARGGLPLAAPLLSRFGSLPDLSQARPEGG